MEVFLDPDAWIALLTLTFLEIVLGIDNIIFISIVTGKLPEEDRKKEPELVCFWPCLCESLCCWVFRI